jgi:catalase
MSKASQKSAAKSSVSKATAKIHDQKPVRGAGGELHQTASGATPALTIAQGAPVSDDHNVLKAGQRGPTLLEDFHFPRKDLPF